MSDKNARDIDPKAYIDNALSVVSQMLPASNVLVEQLQPVQPAEPAELDPEQKPEQQPAK